LQVRKVKSCKIDKKGLFITYSKAILQIMPIYPALNQYLAKLNKKSCPLCIYAYGLSLPPLGCVYKYESIYIPIFICRG